MRRTKGDFASVLLLVGMLATSPTWALEATVGPTLTMDPNGVTPLAGLIDLETDVPTRVTLTISGGAETRTIVFKAFQTVHEVQVLGLKPDNAYTLEVAITDVAGDSVVLTPELNAVTPPLPADFPVITVFY